MLSNPYYQKLKQRVDAGRLILLSIVSPPRTGSTVLEKALYNAYPVLSAQINEPSSQIHAGENRVAAMYQSIWQVVENLEAFAAQQQIDLQQQPLVVLTKNLFYYIGQDQEWQIYDSLMAHHIVTVRHPAATFESYTKAIIETLEKQGTPLMEVIKADVDLCHINWADPTDSPLKQHISYMNRLRDYSTLGEGFRNAVAYQLAILQTRSYQREIWQGTKQGLLMASEDPDGLALAEGFGSWDELIGHYLGTPLSALKDLPQELRKPIDVLRYGWTATKINMAAVRDPGQRLTVIDYYDFLVDPNFYLDKIGQIAGLQGYGDGLGHIRAEFNLGVWEGEPNEEPFFSEVKRQQSIGRPRKSPVPLHSLPEYLADPIEEAFQIYLKILQSPQRLMPRYTCCQLLNMSSGKQDKTLRELDPVHAYAQIAVGRDSLLTAERYGQLQALRNQYGCFRAYFDMIDGAVLQEISGS